MEQSVVIIGGGINGLMTAFYLNKNQIPVKILDQGDLTDGCSFGNAGYVSPSHIIPLASPGVISRGLKWLINKESPFYLQPRLDLELYRWLFTFVKKANLKQVEYAIPHLKEFLLYSRELYDQIFLNEIPNQEWIKDGILMVYNTEHGEKEENAIAEKARATGIEASIWNREKVINALPISSTTITGGVHYPVDAHLEPASLMRNLLDYLKNQQNVEILTYKKITGFDIRNGKIAAVQSGDEKWPGSDFVMTAGVWSADLLKTLGHNMPVQAGKGYHIDFDIGDKNFALPMILVERRVAITPFGRRLRMAGTMEITSLNDKINFHRIRGIEKSMLNFFPGFPLPDHQHRSLWSGFRPCSPDGLPYIGQTRLYGNLFISAGHCMLGLSLGAASGKVIADEISGKVPEVDISPFAVDRYN